MKTIADMLREEGIEQGIEQGVALEVNINTITKGYNILENDGMIEKQRGLGFFVTEDAYTQVLTERKQLFQQETLPKLKQELRLLNLSDQALLQLVNYPPLKR